MSRILEAIDRECAAADELIRACARHGAMVDSSANDNPFVTTLRRQFRVARFTPTDMLASLGKMK